MRDSEKTKLQILILLAGLLCVSFFWNRSELRQTVPAVSPKKPDAFVSVQTDEVPQLSLLNKAPSSLQVKRNIFRFHEAQNYVPAIESPLEFANNPKIAPPAAPEIPDLRYLGFYQEKKPSKVKLAAISNGGKIYVGGVGDVLADKYEVLRVNDDFVVLKILADNRVIRFSLGNVSGTAVVVNPGN